MKAEGLPDARMQEEQSSPTDAELMEARGRGTARLIGTGCFSPLQEPGQHWATRFQEQVCAKSQRGSSIPQATRSRSARYLPSNPRCIFLHCSVFSVTLLVIVHADVFGLWAALFPLYCGLSGGILPDSCFPQSPSQEAAIKTSSAACAWRALSGDCSVRRL